MEGYQYGVWTYNGRGLDNGRYSGTFIEAMSHMMEKTRRRQTMILRSSEKQSTMSFQK